MVESITSTTNNSTTVLPSQKKTYAEKIAKDFQWAKDSINAIISNTNFTRSDYDEMAKLRRAREGNLIMEDYTYILNPLNSKDNKYKKYPAKLKNYPLIGPVIDLLLGELSNRPKIEQVVATDSDITNKKKEALNIAIEKGLQQQFINELNAAGEDTGIPSKEVDLQKIIENINETFDDKLAIQGQDALDYLYYDLELDEKYQQLFNDYLTVGRWFTFKEIKYNDVRLEVVPAEDVSFSNNNVNFVEDMDWIVQKLKWTKNQIIDNLYEELDEKDLEDLESDINFNQVILGTGDLNKGENSSVNSLYYYPEAYRVQWTAYKKVGILTYQNLLGEPISMEVDDTYKLDIEKGDISIKWLWLNEKWEGLRIGNKFYKVRPLIAQRNELNNLSACKLGFNGKVALTKTNEISSIVKTGYTFQVLFNIYHFQHEMIMNKNKDKIVFMPLELIPDGQGWTEDKFMYTANALSYAFIDTSKPGALAALQGIKVIDLSLAQYASEMYNLLQEVKAEFWDAIGMNRQRFGDVKASDGKGNTEQAIFRSAIVNETLFGAFDRYKEKEAQALIDYSKLAWVEGKKGTFRNSEGVVKTLDIVGYDYCNTEFGVFCKNSSKEIEKAKTYKNLSLSLLQNEGNHAAIAEILDTDNYSKIKSISAKYDKIKRDFAERQQAANEKAAADTIASNNKIADDKNQTEIYKADSAYQMGIEVANIQNDNKAETNDKEKLDLTKELKEKDLAFKKTQHEDKMKLENKKLTDKTTTK